MQWQNYVATIGPALQQQFHNTNTSTVLFWTTALLCCAYLCFDTLMQAFLKSSKVSTIRRRPAIRYIWCSCFYAASVSYLLIYHQSFISTPIQNIFSNFHDTLFIKTGSCRFNHIAVIIIAFHLHTGIIDVVCSCDYSEGISHFLYSVSLVSLRDSGFDMFSIVLNCLSGLYYLLSNNLALLALFTNNRNQVAMRLYGALKIIAWAFIFLYMIPFKYLLPALSALNASYSLNLFLWCWYGSCVWNSPMLQYSYHQFYHTSFQDCAGIDSNMKCVLIKDTDEMKHMRALQKAITEIRTATKSKNNPLDQNSATASTKAFQAIRCVMLLKRKLKRIRQKSAEVPTEPTDISLNQPVDETLDNVSVVQIN